MASCLTVSGGEVWRAWHCRQMSWAHGVAGGVCEELVFQRHQFSLVRGTETLRGGILADIHSQKKLAVELTPTR